MSEHSMEERLADTLHERASRDVPYNLNLWPLISSRAEKQSRKHRRPDIFRLPFGRPNLVVAAYLTVLVLAVAVTFSLAPGLKGDGSTALTPGGQSQYTPVPTITPDATATQYTADYNASRAPYAYLDRSKYGKHLGISQTSGDYTLTLNWMYADGNLVLIDFDLLGPQPELGPGGRITPYIAALSVKDGPVLSSERTQYTSKAEGNRVHYLMERDVAEALDKYGNQELDFNLTIAVDAIKIRPKAQGTIPGGTTWDIDSQDVESQDVESQDVERIRERDIAGPFSFQLSVPFIPARIAGSVQTATANNVEVALQQFRVSPSMIRSYILVAPGDKALSPDEWEISAGAQVNNWDALMFRTGKIPYGHMLTSSAGVHTIYDNVYDQQGEWTFTVRKFLNNRTQETIEGPWVFKFEALTASPYSNRWRLIEPSPIPTR
jgi:hypothetical protein